MRYNHYLSICQSYLKFGILLENWYEVSYRHLLTPTYIWPILRSLHVARRQNHLKSKKHTWMPRHLMDRASDCKDWELFPIVIHVHSIDYRAV